jgi:hypothetical protein
MPAILIPFIDPTARVLCIRALAPGRGRLGQLWAIVVMVFPCKSVSLAEITFVRLALYDAFTPILTAFIANMFRPTTKLWQCGTYLGIRINVVSTSISYALGYHPSEHFPIPLYGSADIWRFGHRIRNLYHIAIG